MPVHTSFLRISYSDELVNGQPVFVSSNSLLVKALKYEPAGHSFHSAILKLLGSDKEEASPIPDPSVSSEKEKSHIPSFDSYSSTKGKKKSGAGGGGGGEQDHYALLGLSHLRYLATEDQIRRNYREAALKHHPDKLTNLLLAEESEAAKQAKKDEIEARFMSIQAAYEILIDPVKRRIYDCTDEFDDEIPTNCAPQDFFRVFGPAFMRNGRWSLIQPIPSLGDDNTPFKQVDDFYNFWYSFKSWREFPHADEFDLEEAESRDHKRWMERQNAKLSEKARKKECIRIRSLVDNAYRRDPRLLRRKEEEKAEKNRKKEAKVMAKKMQEEEMARAALEEQKRKAEEVRLAAEAASQQKKVKEKEKKLLRKERARLRNLSAPVRSHVSDDDVESLCMSLSTIQLRDLCDQMENKEGVELAQVVREALGGSINGMDNAVQDRKIQQNGGGSTKAKVPPTVSLGSSFAKKEKPWTKKEIELLVKGMHKFPKGTSGRWEVISEFIGTGRPVDEVFKATKTVLLQKPDSSNAFDSFLEKRKSGPSIASPLTTRAEVVGETVQPELSSNTNEKKMEKVEEQVSESCSSKVSVLVEEPALNSDADAWSAVQERALVKALKTFPNDTSQRWERVAAAVPGRSLNQCKKKFAEMKDSFRNKKTTA